MRVSSSKEIPEYEITPSKLKFTGSKSKLPDVSSCDLLILPQLRMAWEYKPIVSITDEYLMFIDFLTWYSYLGFESKDEKSQGCLRLKSVGKIIFSCR